MVRVGSIVSRLWAWLRSLIREIVGGVIVALLMSGGLGAFGHRVQSALGWRLPLWFLIVAVVVIAIVLWPVRRVMKAAVPKVKLNEEQKKLIREMAPRPTREVKADWLASVSGLSYPITVNTLNQLREFGLVHVGVKFDYKLTAQGLAYAVKHKMTESSPPETSGTA